MFSGVIGQEYRPLKRISPLAIEMSRPVGVAVASAFVDAQDAMQVVEVGGGAGITALALSQEAGLTAQARSSQSSQCVIEGPQTR